jgi:rare lipoprotein A (peptidoglycan hydrolase)
MNYNVRVFRIVFLVICLCIFGSTKSVNAFDFSNSTAMEAQDGSVSENINLRVEPEKLISPPQPRNKRGELVCTRNRYVQDERQIGKASWYGGIFHGRATASGEVFNKHALTIAHLTLPMGTRVLVENPDTGVAIQARVNDCGPFVKGRIADLSQGLARYLGILKAGTGRVIITVL